MDNDTKRISLARSIGRTERDPSYGRNSSMWTDVETRIRDVDIQDKLHTLHDLNETISPNPDRTNSRTNSTKLGGATFGGPDGSVASSAGGGAKPPQRSRLLDERDLEVNTQARRGRLVVCAVDLDARGSGQVSRKDAWWWSTLVSICLGLLIPWWWNDAERLPFLYQKPQE